LARKGYRVLLVDRTRFPSDIPHGHFIHRGGPQQLQRWGLLERLVAGGCPPVTAMTTDLGDFALTGRDLSADGVALGYAPRRSRLDQLLVEAAVEAGVEFRPGFAVQGFTGEAGRLTGIRGRDTASGAVVSEYALLTIGADGRNSRLAAAVRAPVYEAAPALTFWYFSYWSDVQVDGLEVYDHDRRVLLAFPTHAGLNGVFVGWPADELPTVKADLDRQFMAAVDLSPNFAERLRAGRRVEPYYGATDLPNFYRRPYGPGWALVGDAGHHKDPYLALGIRDALRDAEWLAEAVDAGLSGRQPLPGALEAYEQRRNAASRADYRETLAVAQLMPWPAQSLHLRAALRGDEAATRAFYMARQELRPRETFFNPANLDRLMRRAAPEREAVPG
jgi:2-polyprenyl-6-methoxyphenol hydroxylase-like FAD-dependent oxidoreductase